MNKCCRLIRSKVNRYHNTSKFLNRCVYSSFYVILKISFILNDTQSSAFSTFKLNVSLFDLHQNIYSQNFAG